MQQTTDRIISIHETGTEQTFDLIVPNIHNFILGNGIVTHNSGKSYSSLSIAETIGELFKKPFKAENVGYMNDEIMEIAKKLKERNTIMKDENPYSAGVGSGRARQEMTTLEETIRKRQLNLIFNSPRIHSHIHHFILKTYGIDRKHNIARLLVFTEADRHYPLGYITVAKPSDTTLKGYEKIKDAFLEKVTSRQVGSGYHEKIAREMQDDEKYMELRPWSLKTAYIGIKHPNLTEEEKKRIRDLSQIL